jgi:hypothetical protein
MNHHYMVRITRPNKSVMRYIALSSPDAIFAQAQNAASKEDKVEYKLLGEGAPTVATHGRRKLWTTDQAASYNAGYAGVGGPSSRVDCMWALGEADYEKAQEQRREMQAEREQDEAGD